MTSVPLATPSARKINPGVILFTTTAFLGASLIFLVQPLVSKILLPYYGGSAAVWTTSSFFFQVLLLLGYILVHLLVRTGKRKQPVIQFLLLGTALLFLPLVLPGNAEPTDGSPTLWLIRTLALMIAVPFFVLSMTGPLLQKWYSWANLPRAEDPYFLYAASNVGSFVGLFSYPFLIEANISLASQRLVWTVLFFVFAGLMVLCGLFVLKSKRVAAAAAAAVEDSETPAAKLTPPTLKQQVIWVALAFLPSSLMLGATTYITTDIASIPLLWTLPLGIYIATMVWAFGRTTREVSKNAVGVAILFSIIALFFIGPFREVHLNVYMLLALTLTTLAVIALGAHFALAATRPDPEYLTKYFMLVSLGGALGGAFNSFVAPNVFNGPLEYPLVLATVPLLMLTISKIKKYPAFLVIAALGLVAVGNAPQAFVTEKTRTFYGSYTVKESPTEVLFVHGTTAHGLQMKNSPETPDTYFNEAGPLGDIFKEKDYKEVTVVGLGGGTIAAYGEPGMNMRFVEIDSEVVRIAEEHFTYLEDSKADIENIVGDGRLAIGKMEDESQELILLDAFSSDSIPIHIITQEAIKEYKTKLTEDGFIAVHISNRFFNLKPVLVGAAKEAGLTPITKKFVKKPGVIGETNTWVALVPEGAIKESLLKKGWEDLSGAKSIDWTDDYSSILDVIE